MPYALPTYYKIQLRQMCQAPKVFRHLPFKWDKMCMQNVDEFGHRKRKFRYSKNEEDEDPGKVFFLTMCPTGSFLNVAIRQEFKEFGDDIEVLQVNDLGKGDFTD